jgi:integrase
MRLAEATSLRWGDINFEDGRFNVTGGETGTKNHESRQVPLFPAMGRLLEWILGWCPTPPERDDLVVPIKSARKAMDNACKKADLPNFTHHSLRHYFCTNAVEAAVDFKTIAAWVGHKDGGLLVAKTYGHLRDTHSYEMAKRMDYTAELSPTDQT